MISIELIAIMATIGYIAFAFIAETFNPFYISSLKRKRKLHALGITAAFLIAASPFVLKIWPTSGLREQISLILLVLLAAMVCLIVLHGCYYLFTRLFGRQSTSQHAESTKKASSSGASLLTNTAGAPTSITNHTSSTEPAESNTPPIEINADRMFDANLEAALDSADADLKTAQTETASSTNLTPSPVQTEASFHTVKKPNFARISNDIVEAEWSEPAENPASDEAQPETKSIEHNSPVDDSKTTEHTELTVKTDAQEPPVSIEKLPTAIDAEQDKQPSESTAPAENITAKTAEYTESATAADEVTKKPVLHTVPESEISSALTAIKGKTVHLRSTIEQVSDQQVIGQQRFEQLRQKQQEQLSSQRREINRQASLVREMESRESQRANELTRIDELRSATDLLINAQREQLEEARRFRQQAERLLTAREQALIKRERALQQQEQELAKSRMVAKKAALAARKAALAHQQVHATMLREKQVRNRTEERAQKAVSIARDAISKLATEEAKNRHIPSAR